MPVGFYNKPEVGEAANHRLHIALTKADTLVSFP